MRAVQKAHRGMHLLPRNPGLRTASLGCVCMEITGKPRSPFLPAASFRVRAVVSIPGAGQPSLDHRGRTPPH